MPGDDSSVRDALNHHSLQVSRDDPGPRPMIAVLDARPDLAGQLREKIAELAAQVRREPGCLAFTAYEARDVPGRFCVLTVPGRRTGKPRSAPVSPLTVSGGRYVVSALPDSDWARNARAAGHAQLSRGRRREPVTLTEVTASTLKEQVMRAYPHEVPEGAPMFVRAGIATGPDPAAASHVAVFQIRPAPPARRNEDAP